MRAKSLFTRILLVLGLVVAGAVTAIPQADAATKTATSAHQVYTTTGTWAFNGRTWSTNCTPYSSTVERCRTEIWATVTVYENGRFTSKPMWAFNNLTYKNSPRDTWAEFNPLVTPGEHTVDGRRWKTECNTAWTGSNACRSQIWATVPELNNGKWSNVNKWVFNNIVHLTPVSCAVTETALADVLKEPAVINSCLRSKVNTNWLVTTFPQVDAEGTHYREVAFFERKDAGWAIGPRGRHGQQTICDAVGEDKVPAHDLFDTISYCFSG